MTAPTPIREQDGVVVVTVEADRCASLSSLIDPLLGEGKRAFVLDLGRIEYLNSMNIACLISVRSRITTAGGRIVLANLPESVKAVFRVLRLEKLFRFDLPLEQAIAAVK